jgi:hypothetical protein
MYFDTRRTNLELSWDCQTVVPGVCPMEKAYVVGRNEANMQIERQNWEESEGNPTMFSL